MIDDVIPPKFAPKARAIAKMLKPKNLVKLKPVLFMSFDNSPSFPKIYVFISRKALVFKKRTNFDYKMPFLIFSDYSFLVFFRPANLSVFFNLLGRKHNSTIRTQGSFVDFQLDKAFRQLCFLRRSHRFIKVG